MFLVPRPEELNLIVWHIMGDIVYLGVIQLPDGSFIMWNEKTIEQWLPLYTRLQASDWDWQSHCHFLIKCETTLIAHVLQGISWL